MQTTSKMFFRCILSNTVTKYFQFKINKPYMNANSLKKAYKIPVKDIQETKNGCLGRREMGDMGHRWNKDLPLWILWYELIFELCEYITYSESKNITNGVLPFIFNENCLIQFQWIFLILFQWVFPKRYNRWRKPNQSYKTYTQIRYLSILA